MKVIKTIIYQGGDHMLSLSFHESEDGAGACIKYFGKKGQVQKRSTAVIVWNQMVRSFAQRHNVDRSTLQGWIIE